MIDAPELGPLFGPNSRGEVAADGASAPAGAPGSRPIAGGSTGWSADDDGVLIVDFKLGAKPARPAAAHVAQLALYRAALQPLYPGQPVRAALVYLDGPTIAPIGDEELEAALDALRAAS